MRATHIVPAVLAAAGLTACSNSGGGGGGVDLHPFGVVVSPANPDTDSTITLAFGIANDGSNDAGASAWVVKLDDQVIGGGTTGAIAAHGSTAASISFPAFEAGAHTMQVVANPEGEMGERDQANNSVSVPITVSPKPAVFDLRPGGTFEFSPSPPTCADALLLWTITNADTSGAGRSMQSVHWHLLCDGAYVGSGTFDSLAPNETRQQTYQLAGTFAGTAGPHHYTILLDPHHTLQESDETNNTMELDAVVVPTPCTGG
jgi:subtilase family serine protease